MGKETLASRLRGATEKEITVKIQGEEVKLRIRKVGPEDFMGFASGIMPIPELVKNPKRAQKSLAEKTQNDIGIMSDLWFLVVQKGLVGPLRLVDDSTEEFGPNDVAPRHLGMAFIAIFNEIAQFSGLDLDASPF